MKRLDIELFMKHELICGVDEVGRGSIIGPVVACAAIFKRESNLNEVDDSKVLSKKKRNILDLQIKDQVIDYAFGSASIEEIDEINIYQATKLAMNRAIDNLRIKPDYILIDAMKLERENSLAVIKGDKNSAIIGAASILAKVYRDDLIDEMSKDFPMYDFENNKGYLTKKHRLAIEKFGVTPIHRKSFEPIKSLLNHPNKKV